MRIFGLIGKKLDHSFSPGYFNEKFRVEGILDASYRAFPLDEISDFPALLSSMPNLRGLNVTIPYKEAIIPYLDELDKSAEAVGAVNCIDIRNEKLIGHNTDITGFEKSLMQILKGRKDIDRALVLGSGGAAKAVNFVLKKLEIQYITLSRNPKQNQIAYKDIDKQLIKEHKLIINCSPLGMYPNLESCPEIPYHFLGNNHILYDLVYNPPETTFMKNGKNRGAEVVNGLEMLHVQAEAAWEIWNG
jgi:shikimate dehydrogenase